MKYKFNQESANQLDQQDPLRGFRSRFVITDPDLIYMDGNSLGTPAKSCSSAYSNGCQ